MNNMPTDIADLDQRSRDIFKRLVETYLDTGDPVGSRTLSKSLPVTLSPASVRNVMSDLESLGLIFSPHKSAGRVPTQSGLRLFVDGFLEVSGLAADEQSAIAERLGKSNTDATVEDMLTRASNILSGLSHCAGLVVAPKVNLKLKHIEFVALEPTRALAIMVGDDGSVENRVIDLPPGMPTSTLTEAGNYLNAHITGKTIAQAQKIIQANIDTRSSELDTLTKKVIEMGLAVWSGDEDDPKSLIIRGRSNLLDDVSGREELERIRQLFDDLESKRELMRLLGLANEGEGVRIFIGSENKLFSMSGSSLVVAPYRGSDQQIIGAVGVIGPTRLNYGRIIPMVDYTAQLIGKLLT